VIKKRQQGERECSQILFWGKKKEGKRRKKRERARGPTSNQRLGVGKGGGEEQATKVGEKNTRLGQGRGGGVPRREGNKEREDPWGKLGEEQMRPWKERKR